MSATSVSVVLPRGEAASGGAAETISTYLESTGFTFEILQPEGADHGVALRRGVSDATGSVIVIVDPELPYAVDAIGDAVAMVESGATDVVFARTRNDDRSSTILRWLLVSNLPDREIDLAAFSSTAGKVVAGESRLPGRGCALEMAFLANKYGFRVEYLLVHANDHANSALRRRSFGAFGGIAAAISIRLANRRNVYRAPKRCPVCFSSEVWSCAQIPGNVVRACRRCKCRYLNQFVEDEGESPVRRVIGVQPVSSPPAYEPHSPPSHERTSLRRYRWLQKRLSSRARILEVGVRDGSFGAAAAAAYEYVGIDPAAAAVRHARARGLDVYCASLSSFVNTGPSFDAITLFHIMENMPDPHDALERIKELLKPGGILLLSAIDTEGLIYLMTERRRMAQNFRTHLILYSRSALIEILEHSGFEIVDVGPDFEYRDQRLLRHWMGSHHPFLAPVGRLVLKMLPDPLMVSTGSIRIVAKRRSGHPFDVRTLPAVEPTHAR